MAQYTPPLEGSYQDIADPERSLGRCLNMIALTHGQRAGIGGADDRCGVGSPPEHGLGPTSVGTRVR